MSPRRDRGEGSVYRRADGMWAATVEHGQIGGKRRRQVLYAKTKPGLLRKKDMSRSEMIRAAPARLPA